MIIKLLTDKDPHKRPDTSGVLTMISALHSPDDV